MSTNSFRAMTRDGDSKAGIEPTIKRTDAGMFIRRKNIFIKDGFNPRRDRPELAEHIRQFADTIIAEIKAGVSQTKIPKLFVHPRDEGGVWVDEGHCRTAAYDLAAEEGYPIDWIGIDQFVGSPTESLAFTASSNNQLPLTPYERADVYRRLRDEPEHFVDGKPLTTSEIAKLVGRTRQHVESLLLVADADDSVKALVLSGEVKAGVASEMIREHGAEAGAVLTSELVKAKAVGKKTVTKSTIQGRPIPRELADGLSNIATKLRDTLPEQTKLALQQFRDGDDEVQVTIDIRSLNALLAIQEEIEKVRADQAAKAAEKAAKADQKEEVNA